MLNFQKNGFMNNKNSNTMNTSVNGNNSIRKTPLQIKEEMIRLRSMNSNVPNNPQIEQQLKEQEKQINTVEQRNRLSAIRNISKGR